VAGTGLAAEAVDFLRTAGSPAIQVVPLSVERARDRVPPCVRFTVALLRVRRSPRERTTGATVVLAPECDSGPMAAEATAITSATDA
jgi:hypothetical protein